MSISKTTFNQARRYLTFKAGSQVPHNFVNLVELPIADEVVLVQTLETLVERHENLRTLYFDVDHQVFQQVYPLEKLPSYLTIEDINHITDLQVFLSARYQELDSYLFDYQKESCFKCIFLKHRTKSFLLTVMDHMVYDSRSLQIISNEFALLHRALMAGKANPLKPLQLKFCEYSEFYNGHYQGEELLTHQRYLKRLFRNIPKKPKLLAPYDKPTQPGSDEGLGSIYKFYLTQDIVAEIQQLSKRSGGTLANVLITAYCVFFSKVSDQRSFTLDTPISTRNSPEFNNLVGWMVGCLVYQIKVAPEQTFEFLISTCGEQMFEAMEHMYYQDVDSHLKGEWSDHSLQINIIDREFALIEDFSCKHKQHPESTYFDFSFACYVHQNGIMIDLRYRFDAISKEKVGMFCDDFIKTLMACVRSPSSDVKTINSRVGVQGA